MQGLQQFRQYAVVEIVSAATRVALLVAYRSGLTLQGLLYIEVASQLVEIVLQLFCTRALLVSLTRQDFAADSMRSLGRFSMPLYSNNMLGLAADRSSDFLIGALLNPASVAAFEIALKIPDGFTRLFDAFVVVYFPNLSSLLARDARDDARKVMNGSLVLLSAGIVLLVLVSFLFGGTIIQVLFSNQYEGVWLAFGLLMVNFFLRSMANILGYSLVADGHSSAPLRANLVASAVNILGSLVLIPAFGYVGAVYSLMLMNTTAQIIYLFILRRAGLAADLLEYLKPVLVLAVALGLYWLLGSQSLLLRLLLVASYVAACWLLIKRVRDFSYSVLRHIFQPRIRIESAE
jgi:O-antigen/teichoic acid export membrane protein